MPEVKTYVGIVVKRVKELEHNIAELKTALQQLRGKHTTFDEADIAKDERYAVQLLFNKYKETMDEYTQYLSRPVTLHDTE